MKKRVQAEELLAEETIVLTPSALLAFLSQIEELDTAGNLSIEEADRKLIVSIGDSTYVLEGNADSVVSVDDEVADVIDEINEEGYDEIDAEEVEGEPVEGGILKELVKTLAIGGLVRLTKNAIMKS